MDHGASPPGHTSKPGNTSGDGVRVLVIEDSVIIRGLICRALESEPGIKHVMSASDGAQGVNMFKRMPADVIVLDIEMPVMDGLTAIPLLLEIDPHVKIIMASTLTQRNAEISFKAMDLGAADYLPKPTSSRELAAATDFKRELVDKVKAFAAHARRLGVRHPIDAVATTPSFRAATPATPKAAGLGFRTGPKPAEAIKPPPDSKNYTLKPWPAFRPEILAIGSSTGGPQALFKVIKVLGTGLPQPVVITQHMPPSFTTILAEHITKTCGVTCAEAKDGQELVPGNYYLAPGDYHMTIARGVGGKKIASLNQDPPENFCRPAVDPMLRSLIQHFGKNTLVMILTGMGSDGWKGCEAIVQAGGAVLAQDEATSVVWGMPGAVATAGLCSAIQPIDKLGITMRGLALGLKP